MNIDFSFVPKHYASRSHEKMQEVLMDPDGKGPAIHYYMIRGGKDQRNITVWEPGTISGEYIKTYGHYHVGELDETYWILFGEGIALLQKLATDENGEMIVEGMAFLTDELGDLLGGDRRDYQTCPLDVKHAAERTALLVFYNGLVLGVAVGVAASVLRTVGSGLEKLLQ